MRHNNGRTEEPEQAWTIGDIHVIARRAAWEQIKEWQGLTLRTAIVAVTVVYAGPFPEFLSELMGF